MYDPSLGRWLQLDPIGFDGGTFNEYELEGDNPVDRTDPSGLVTVYYAGRGADLNDMTGIMQRMYHGLPGLSAMYSSPEEPAAPDISKALDDAYEFIKKAKTANPNEPVFIVGYSRGGVLAVLLAHRLKKDNIKVNFLGVIDAVPGGMKTDDLLPIYPKECQFPKGDRRRGNLTGGYTALIPNNVQAAFIASGTKAAGSGDWRDAQIIRLKLKAEDSTNTRVTVKSYELGHLPVGESKDVQKDLELAAGAAGLPGLKKP